MIVGFTKSGLVQDVKEPWTTPRQCARWRMLTPAPTSCSRQRRFADHLTTVLGDLLWRTADTRNRLRAQ